MLPLILPIFFLNIFIDYAGERGVKVQRISSIDDRWKIDRGRVKIV